jgi:hypothetical protein
LLQERLPFADSNASLQRQKREQIVESPDSAQSVWLGTFLPKLLKVPERLWWSDFVPIVFDIEKFSTNGTGVQNFFDTELFPARRIDTLLINGHGDILGRLR